MKVNPGVAPVGQGFLLSSRYLLAEELGRGTFGTVYRAFDKEIEEHVALKVLHLHHANREEVLERLKAEVRLARKIRNAHVVRVDDLGGDLTEVFFISMELVEGPHLGRLLELHAKRRLELPEAIRLLTHVASGVAAAHAEEVIHRDLKPQNILITPAGTAKISDFSIARTLAVGESALTCTGEMLGTPFYMAPEQFRSSRVDSRADIYSWSILAFETLAGVRPFVHSTYYGLAELHRAEPLPNISTYRSDVSQALRSLIEACAEKKPENRPSSMHEVVQTLEGVAPGSGGQLSSRALKPWRRQRRRTAMRRYLFRLLQGVVLLGMVSALISASAVLAQKQAYALGALARQQLPAFIAAPLRLLLHMPIAGDDGQLLEVLLADTAQLDDNEERIQGLIWTGLGTRVGADGVRVDRRLWAPIIRSGHSRIISAFIHAGADLAWRGPVGENLLSFAINEQKIDACVVLMATRRDWSGADAFGRTALHTAISNSLFAVARSLAEGMLFADTPIPALSMNAQTLEGLTPLHQMVLSRSLEKRQQTWIYSVPFDLTVRDRYGRTPLLLAAIEDEFSLQWFLARKPAESRAALEMTDNEALTPLYQAVYHTHYAAARALLRFGATPCTVPIEGRALVDVARGDSPNEDERIVAGLLRQFEGKCK